MKKTILVLSIALIAAGCNSQPVTQNTNQNSIATYPTPNLTDKNKTDGASTIYTSSAYHFSIYQPIDSTLKESQEDSTLCCGRLGNVIITEKAMSIKNIPSVAINVYKTKSNLETDFSSGPGSTIDSTMASLGLKKTNLTISGQQAVVYYGAHIADVPGGGDSWPYIAAEIAGPTYAYMIEFNFISTDPKDSHIRQYLNSFTPN